MQDLTVAVVQINQFWENKSANYDHVTALLTSLNTPVDLIVLPEMFDTAFSMNTDLAEPWEENPSLRFLQETAHRQSSAVYTSLMCQEKGRFYNRGVFVYPTGAFEIYDKRKTFGLAGEDRVFTAGDSMQVVQYNDWRIQLQICYDLRFPEICRNWMSEDGQPGYDLMIYVANWPERRSEHWKALLQARAIENQCYVVGANRIGEDGKQLTYTGDSVCVNALGEASYCEARTETIGIFKLSKKSLRAVRSSLPFLKDR